MTSILEKIIALVAPHSCFVCGAEDNVLCDACLAAEWQNMLSLCVFCGLPTADWRLCKHCSFKNPLVYVWVAAKYEGLAEQLLHDFKFARCKAAARPLADAVAATLPYLDSNTLIVPIPTAPRRVRQRGYDQTLLIAKELAKLKDLTVASLLRRVGSSRQVGASRSNRRAQAEKASAINGDVRGKKILLIDDICTTGSTLRAAAALLAKHGAAEVNAAVVAWQPPRK